MIVRIQGIELHDCVFLHESLFLVHDQIAWGLFKGLEIQVWVIKGVI